MRKILESVQDDVKMFKEMELFFDCSQLLKLVDLMNAEEKINFDFDIRKCDLNY